MMDLLQQLADKLAKTFKQDFVGYELLLQELTINVKQNSIIKVLMYLRDHKDYLFKQLIDICGVDYPERLPRFDVVYHLLSLKHNIRLRLKVQTDDNIPIPSAITVYSAANWWEREVWDMFGLKFKDHPNLDRLLTDYEFEGHPLRKDFPLTGYVEVRYDDEHKKVVYDTLQLPQAYRHFDFLSPWEGASPSLLPGDEKAS